MQPGATPQTPRGDKSAPNRLRPMTRCQVLPLPGEQFQFQLDGREVTRWHFGQQSPRPFFYPLNGPSGHSLTRMGHPGAPNHDHHRSLWFAHHDLLAIDFWTEKTSAVIRQKQWYAIADGDAQARLAISLAWLDGHDPTPIVEQDVIITMRPEPSGRAEQQLSDQAGDWSLELQCDFRTPAEGVAFRRSNFGILALRVAKSLSVIFGDGVITGADRRQGEAELFGQPNRWIDYSGPIGRDGTGDLVIEGVAVIDHRSNPGHDADPWASWHVRDDGWIGPSLSRHRAVELQADTPLRCRYLAYVHAGSCDPQTIDSMADRFDRSAALRIAPSDRAHHQFQLVPG